MDNPNYAVNDESIAKYSTKDNMESVNIEQKQLISESKQKFKNRNKKKILLAVGMVVGCVFLASVCFMFFSLGKSRGDRYIQGADGQQDENVWRPQVLRFLNEIQNKTFSGRQTIEEGRKLIPNRNSLDNQIVEKVVTKLRTVLEEMENKSRQELSNIKKTIDDIRQENKRDFQRIEMVIEKARNESRLGLAKMNNESTIAIMNVLKGLQNMTLPDGFYGTNEVAPKRAKDCVELKEFGNTSSGVYTVYPSEFNSSMKLKVYCDMITDGGGWLVFQRRTNGSTNFYRNWKAYEDGFGDLNNEFWLGNENLHILTSKNPTELRIDIEAWDGNRRYAKYSSFKIGNKDSEYTLTTSGYSGNAGDGMNYHEGAKFSTFDEDNDHYSLNCATSAKAAWWYKSCSHSSLNGEYITGTNGRAGTNQGINWEKYKGDAYSLKSASMMLRRKI